jgi:hypothetical protein
MELKVAAMLRKLRLPPFAVTFLTRKTNSSVARFG